MKKMKKSFYIFSILLFSLSTSIFGQKSVNMLDNGFYYLSETELESIAVEDSDSDQIFGIEMNSILTSKDYSKIKIVLSYPKDIKYDNVELYLNKTGRNKLKVISDRILKSKENIVFVFNNKVLLTKQILNNSNLAYNKIILPFEKEEITNFKSTIQQEIENFKVLNDK